VIEQRWSWKLSVFPPEWRYYVERTGVRVVDPVDPAATSS
jgi:hypothetical protein